ncbi:hypothetical protein [Flavobacterium sp. 5]|nr:hypothetical protein [Flavobacterium sp. 5]PKB16896.1 hypothetical protein CLU82_2049 [Flavobacterium sp. 5]
MKTTMTRIVSNTSTNKEKSIRFEAQAPIIESIIETIVEPIIYKC